MLNRFLYFMRQPIFRPLYAVIWTALSLLLLLQPSSNPVIGPKAPPGDPNLGRELLLITGHIVVFSVMTALWWWTFLITSPYRRALVIAVTAALVIGGITEIVQLGVPNRAPSLDDLAMNWLVTVATALTIQLCMQRFILFSQAE